MVWYIAVERLRPSGVAMPICQARAAFVLEHMRVLLLGVGTFLIFVGVLAVMAYIFPLPLAQRANVAAGNTVVGLVVIALLLL